MCGYGFQTQSFDIVESCGQSRGADIVRRAGFELIGQFVVGGLFECHLGDHLSATVVGGDLLQPLRFAIQYAYSCGCVDFMAGEGVEIRSQLPNIYPAVGDGLCSIDQNGYSGGMSQIRYPAYGIDGAEHIADVGYRNDFGTFVQ